MTFVHIVVRIIEKLSFLFYPVVVIFTMRNLPIRFETVFIMILNHRKIRLRSNWLSLLPVILSLIREELEITLTIGRCLVDVLERRVVIVCSLFLIEVLPVLMMSINIVLTACYM